MESLRIWAMWKLKGLIFFCPPLRLWVCALDWVPEGLICCCRMNCS